MAIVQIWGYPQGGSLSPQQQESWAIGPFSAAFDGTFQVAAHPAWVQGHPVSQATAVTFMQVALSPSGEHYVNFVVQNTHTTHVYGYTVWLSTIEHPDRSVVPGDRADHQAARLVAVHDADGRISRVVSCPPGLPPMRPTTLEPGQSVSETAPPKAMADGSTQHTLKRLLDVATNYRIDPTSAALARIEPATLTTSA